jgi:predicted amidohydrolase YtcJ
MKERKNIMHRRSFVIVLLILTLLVSASIYSNAQEEINPLLIVPPDIILMNGNVATVDDDFSFAEAVAIRGNTILAVGSNEEIGSLAMEGTRVIDLNGRTVLPGLIDGTLHGVRNGYHCYTQAVRLDGVHSRAEALEMYRAKGEELDPGEWVFTSGGWYVNQLDERGMFTLEELDAVLPENPVTIAGAGAPRQVNSVALELMGVTQDTPDPEGGAFLRDENGNLTGALQGGATTQLINQLIDFTGNSIDKQMDCLSDFIHDANMRGLTSWNDPGGNDPYDPVGGRAIEAFRDNHYYQAVNELHHNDQLNVRIRLHMTSFGGLETVVRDTHRGMSLLGDDMLRLGGPGEEIMGGSATGADAADFDVAGFIERYQPITDYLAQNRWQFEHHSTTPFGNEIMLSVWEATNEKYPITDLNWTMLHPDDTSDETLSRLIALNMNVVPTDGGPHPYRRMYDSGVSMCLGTDAMNTSAPWPPFFNLWHTTTGLSAIPGEQGVAEDQLLTREEALRSATVNCGKLMDLEGRVGSLQPGWLADIIVLSDDYFTVPDEQIYELTSVLTIVDGHIVYSDAEFVGLDMAMDMEDDHDHEADDHDQDDHDDTEMGTVPNNGAVISIVSPVDGDTVAADDFVVEVKVENFALGEDGNHWHIMIDGTVWGMTMSEDTTFVVHGVEPGEHVVTVRLANGEHIDLEEGDEITVNVE